MYIERAENFIIRPGVFVNVKHRALFIFERSGKKTVRIKYSRSVAAIGKGRSSANIFSIYEYKYTGRSDGGKRAITIRQTRAPFKIRYAFNNISLKPGVCQRFSTTDPSDGYTNRRLRGPLNENKNVPHIRDT